MAITDSWGYAGDIDAPEWAKLMPYAAGGQYGVKDFAAWRPTIGGSGDRAVTIAAGLGWGHGVMDTNGSSVTLNLPSVASGSRWDLIVARRIWSTGVTSFQRVAGTSTKALPNRLNTPGTEDEQPIALARVTAGSASVVELIDLRCIPGDSGLLAFNELALQYLNRVGTSIRIGTVDWFRVVSAVGNASWVRTGDTPLFFEGRFRRSDGQQVINNGTTLLKWQTIPSNAPGWTSGQGTSGAYVTLPAGLYMVSASVKMNFGSNAYVQLVLSPQGGVVMSTDSNEIQTPPGYSEVSTGIFLWVTTPTNVIVQLLANAGGSMRLDGYVRVLKVG